MNKFSGLELQIKLMPQAQSFLGVDLSPDSIKLVELKPEKGKPQLVTYGYTESKSDVLKGDFIANKNLTSTLLREVADRAKVTTNYALAAVGISNVFSTVIRLPNLLKKDLENKDKIKTLVSEEVKKVAPRELADLKFSSTIIPTDEIKTASPNAKLEVVRYLITATTKELVDEYKQIFSQANMQLISLDIESFALVHSLVGLDKSLIMLVDIGENRTNLSIVNLTIPILNRSIQVGGSNVTKAIADSLNISISEAESYKLDLGIMMAQENLANFPQPIADALAPIITEIKYLLKTYYDQTGKEKLLDKIILTGGCALLGNFLDKYISSMLDVRTYVGDPWARIIYPEELKPIMLEIGPRFSVAAGLALMKIL